MGAAISFYEGGAPVARQTRRLLEQSSALAPQTASARAGSEVVAPAHLTLLTTGNPDLLENAARRWLERTGRVHKASIAY